MILVFFSTAFYIKQSRRSESFVSNKYFCFICHSYLAVQNSASGNEQITNGKFRSDNVTHGINSRFICCIDEMLILKRLHTQGIIFKEPSYSS